MSSMREKNLSSRQQLFVLGVIRHGDPIQAAIEAGINEASARRMADRWMTHPDHIHLQNLIKEAQAKKREQAGFDAKKIVEELARVAFFNPKRILNDDGELLNLRDMPDEVAASIKKFRVSHRMGIDGNGEPARIRVTEIEFWSKLDALKQMAQHLGLLKDTVKVTNVLALDWSSMMGKKPPTVDEDPIEARIKEAARQPAPMALPGDSLQVRDTIEGSKGEPEEAAR